MIPRSGKIGTIVAESAIAVHRELGPGLLTGCKPGYLLNFGEALMKAGTTRCVNGPRRMIFPLRLSASARASSLFLHPDNMREVGKGDMQALDLADVAQFIEGRDLVPEKYRRYYLHWIRRFLLDSPASNPALSAEDCLRVFVQGLADDRQVQDWQAERGVKLYLFITRLPFSRAKP